MRESHPRGARRARGRGDRPAVRFRVHPGVVAWHDLVRGDVEIDTANIGGDFLIVRSDGTPLYHFAVVVDDASMEMTHIIRGEDHISNTPKHIMLFEALGHAIPAFAHLPLILNPDRTKMSKRKSQTAVADYRAQGFLPEAMVNFLSLLGWSTGTEEEILGLDEIAARFDLEHVQKGGAVFDRDPARVAQRPVDPPPRRRGPHRAAPARSSRPTARPAGSTACRRAEELRPLVPIIQERLPTLGVGRRARRLPVGGHGRGRSGDCSCRSAGTARPPSPPCAPRGRRSPARSGRSRSRPTSSSHRCAALAESNGWKAGDLFMAIRVAVTGRTATPPLFDSLVALGRDRVLARLDAAIASLAKLEDAA